VVVERLFPADHPATQGHFPGNPIIPGAVLLDEALRAVAAEIGAGISPCCIRSAKFLAPVRPGERVAIEFDRTQAGNVRFACTVNGKAVLRGEAACGVAPMAP
jgi:3-hydroxymyristoyl/3-hydroxydecanoyl-(acyl carrier protein) dehydratase